MAYPKFTSLVLILLITVSIIACKKKSTITPSNSLLVLVNYSDTYGSRQYYRIVYGEANNVDSIISTGGGTDTGDNGYLVFNYFNSSYTVTNNNNSSFRVDLNTNSQIDTVFDSRGDDLFYLVYNGIQIGSIDYYNLSTTPPAIVANNYTYNNGDITAINSAATAETYSYDDSKSGQIGDPFRVSDFLNYGRPYLISNHLATALYLNGTLQHTYTYQLDGYGRITRLTDIELNTTGGDDTITYTYVYNY